jgi:hypothetical protein
VQLLQGFGYRVIERMQPWLKREPASFTYLVCT